MIGRNLIYFSVRCLLVDIEVYAYSVHERRPVGVNQDLIC